MGWKGLGPWVHCCFEDDQLGIIRMLMDSGGTMAATVDGACVGHGEGKHQYGLSNDADGDDDGDGERAHMADAAGFAAHAHDF